MLEKLMDRFLIRSEKFKQRALSIAKQVNQPMLVGGILSVQSLALSLPFIPPVIL